MHAETLCFVRKTTILPKHDVLEVVIMVTPYLYIFYIFLKLKKNGLKYILWPGNLALMNP